MAKITPRSKSDVETVVVRTKDGDKKKSGPMAWWKAKTKDEKASQLCSTASYLKENQQYRYRQTALYARLYSNYPLYGWVGSQSTKMNMGSALPSDRPTLNVIQSCVDTQHSRITQSRPRPMFLTDAGNYKERKLGKQLNDFIAGEFYRTDAYAMTALQLKDAEIAGTGVLKVFKKDNKACIERRLLTELLVDPNDALYGRPRQLYELQLMDRSVAAEMWPDKRSTIMNTEQAYPDTGGDSTQTISDQIMIVEAWLLPSGEESGDGQHVIGCTNGLIFEEEYKKKRFPFTFLHYSERMLGFWGQGLAEQLMGTQVEINKLLQTISASINIMGVPRVFIEDGSKIVKAHINNQIGSIVTFRGAPPILQDGTSGIAADIYAQLQRLVEYAYQQSGVSQLSATSQKPAGLNSGEAIRNYDDLQSDRFAALNKKFNSSHEDLADLLFDTVYDIVQETGKYSTVYPNKNGAKEIDFPEIEKIKKDAFVIQCFDTSSLPRDPAGRLQKITEMIQAGMIDVREGRRLLDYPDLNQVEQLANASEERILQILDDMVDDGKYTPPDPFMDLSLAKTLSVQYYNLYSACKLEEEKKEMIRTFNSQVNAMLMQAQQPPPPAPEQPNPALAVPQALPTSDLMPMGAA